MSAEEADSGREGPLTGKRGLSPWLRFSHPLNGLLKGLAPALLPLALMSFVLYFWVTRTAKAAHENPQPAKVVSTAAEASPPPLPPPAPAPPVLSASNGRGSVSLASLVQKKGSVLDTDELWKRVQQGNINAEIQLAQVYIDGTRVRQNCEQARLLLLAAKKKGSRTAADLLTGTYAQQCQ